jgi:hypothetical protein
MPLKRLLIVISAVFLTIATVHAGQSGRKSMNADQTRARAFLNKLKENLKPIPFDRRTWKETGRIFDAEKMATPDKSLTVTLIYLNSYEDADVVAKANKLPSKPTARWSVNGPLMYLVESADADRVSHVLGVFSGEE